MKVYFFEPYALAIPHFETALELIQNHIDSKDDVYLFHCDADLNFCEKNRDHFLPTCLQCISRRKLGVKRIDGNEKIKNSNFIDLSKPEKDLINSWNVSFKDIYELKAYRYENTDMGMAIASSLISFLRSPEPDVTANRYLINRMFKASLKVYLSFKKLLHNEKPDLIYLFNGRYSNIRPVVRLCELYSIKYRIHERGANRTKYSLHENHLPHDFNEFKKKVDELWNTGLESERYKIAETFYQDRKAGKEQAWRSFVAAQNEKELPSNWDTAKRNIVIFNSSEDEFAAIDDSLNDRLFPSQLEGIRFMAELVRGRNDVSVYVRIHPNLKGVINSTVTSIYNIKADNFHVIEPASTISSYQLIDCSSLVVTFGSTVGVEATFWDKPSILLGDSFYKDLGATYNPGTKEELSELLLNERTPKEKLGAYKYGYYLQSFGIDFNLYESEGLFKGRFKGQKINPSRWIQRFLKRRQIEPLIKYISRIHADRF